MVTLQHRIMDRISRKIEFRGLQPGTTSTRGYSAVPSTSDDAAIHSQQNKIDHSDAQPITFSKQSEFGTLSSQHAEYEHRAHLGYVFGASCNPFRSITLDADINRGLVLGAMWHSCQLDWNSLKSVMCSWRMTTNLRRDCHITSQYINAF
jgi:hypothetical protein